MSAKELKKRGFLRFLNVLFLFIVEALFKSRAHNEILEIEAINFYPSFMMHEFDPIQFHAVHVMRSKVCYCN